MFVANVFPTTVPNARADINKLVSNMLLDVRKTPEGSSVNIVFSDVLNEGELLKETFDIDTVPSIRLIKGEKVYHLKWNKSGGLWSKTDLVNFINSGWESAPVEKLRSRVTEGIMLYAEYIVNTMTDRSFTSAMENYLTLRKLINEWTGYKHDLKQYNQNFGKKNSFKKSQMWTLLLHVVLPLVLIGTMVILMVLYCLLKCLSKLCCSGETS